jgi:hypothetical protein
MLDNFQAAARRPEIMDDQAKWALTRMPLAEATLRCWQYIAAEDFLQEVFDNHRGRAYTKVLRFPVIVQLLADVLLANFHSARQRLEQADRNQELATSMQAVYGKLRRMPIAVSQAFLTACTQRLQTVFPETKAAVELPTSVRDFRVVVLDGKAIKHVAKRLKPVRGQKGGVLGGRALVAMRMDTGLAVVMHAHPDGEANDVRFVPKLVPQVRAETDRPILWIADRQFGFPATLTHLGGMPDHFLVRHHGNVRFARDPRVPIRTGIDAKGRPYREEWGWIGGEQNNHRRRVRRITLQRANDAVQLITSLLDADAVPAADLLTLYLQRWGIERLFQQVTEVFGLKALIGSSPEATVFQFAFCMVLYNLMQVIKAYAAEAGAVTVAEVSGEKMFRDLSDQMKAWRVLLDVPMTLMLLALPAPPTATALRDRLRRLLAGRWGEGWRKAPAKKRWTPPSGGKVKHNSVHRLREAFRKKGKSREKE